MEKNELYHWGIKGMKWGRRRYQNKDGSLTPEGRKRYGDDNPDSSEDKTPPKPKTSKEMSNEELSDAIKNLELQKRYNQLYNEMNPQTVSKGKEIATKLLDNAIIPAVTEAGRSLLKDTLLKAGKNVLGLDGDAALSTYDKLKKQADTERLKQQISTAKRKQYEDDKWLNKKIKEDEAEARAEEEREKAEKQADKERVKAEKQAKKEDKKAEKQAKKENKQSEKSNDDLIKDATATLKEVNAQRKAGVNIVDTYGKTLSTVRLSDDPTFSAGKKLLDSLLEDY